MPKAPLVHIADDRFADRVLCGTPPERIVKSGRVASDTEPPAVVDESGSCNAATCRTCLAVFRKIRQRATGDDV